MFRCFQKFGMKVESFYLFQEHFGTFDVIQKLYAKTKIHGTKRGGNLCNKNRWKCHIRKRRVKISATGICYYFIPTALEPCQNVLLCRRERGTERISGPRKWSSMNSRKGHSVVYFNPLSVSFGEKVYGKLTADRI
jgi:hypothetical protein